MNRIPVAKCLEKKLHIMGFEVPDLLIVFITLSLLNLLFGQMPLKALYVWLPTVCLGVILRFGKKDKPEKHLVHWLRYQFKPGVYFAFEPPTRTRKAKSL